MKSKSTEEWRKYFESGNCSIYEIIFNAIRMAALDNPVEFKLERKKIVEGLYASLFTDNVDEIATYEQANDGHVITSCVLQIKDVLEKNQLDGDSNLRVTKEAAISGFICRCYRGIGSTISDLKSHRSKEISLLAATMADQWESMIAELVDKSAETTADKSKSPMPSSILEKWHEFPTVEYVPEPPVEISEKFLDDVDEHENGGGDKDKNESEEKQEKNVDGKEKEKEVKNVEVKTEKESDEELKKGRANNKSKVVVKVENGTNEDTGDIKKASRMRNKRKVEESSEYMLTPIKQEYDDEDQKPSKVKIPKTENPSRTRDEKPIRVKKEVEDHDADEAPRATYRALRMSAGPTPAAAPRGRESRRSSSDTPSNGKYRALRIRAEPTLAATSSRARESRRSSSTSDNTPMEQRLETSKKKLQEGYQAHARAKRNVQLIPEEELHKKASTSRSKKQTRK